MKTIRVAFADYYGLKPEQIPAFGILKRYYDVRVVTHDPDYLIDGGLGRDHLKYDCVKILFVGESYVPDFNQFDYAVGFDDITFGDRYLRVPLFVFYGILDRLASRTFDPAALLRRDFCSFVVSNPDGDPLRIQFFERLSKYKKVSSGGKLLNNVGGRVADKAAFLAKHKFNIAFENSSVRGYTTEKVIQAFAASTVPIYYGNPDIAADFSPAAMVRVASKDDVERAVEEVVALDRDDAAYLARVTAPCAVHSQAWYFERVEAFLRHIVDQPLDAARRLNDWGYQVNIRRRARRMDVVLQLMHPGKLIKGMWAR